MDEQADTDYEIQAEGVGDYEVMATTDEYAAAAAEFDAATAGEGDAPKDNGEVSSDSKKAAKKPADEGDAEADEHDLIAMPSMRVVTNDLSAVNSRKGFFVHSLDISDLDHPTYTGLLSNPSCIDIKLQFCRSSTDESQLLGVMSVSFSSSKQAAAAMEAVKEMRPELTVETLKPTDSITAVVRKWKTDNSIADKPVSGAMVIVKNLDTATVTIEKLTELFPDAEDITISNQSQSNYLGQLKGTRHAYVVFPDKETATAVVDHFSSNPLEFSGRQLIIRHYTEPPNHVPHGYMRLTTRKLVLRQIAHARGLKARAQEDPTYEMPSFWNTRLQTAQELITKDDAAREILGLPKPMLPDFQDISLKQILQKDSENILFKLGIGDDPGANVSGKSMKRSFAGQEAAGKTDQAKKKPVPLLAGRMGRGNPLRMPGADMMMGMRGVRRPRGMGYGALHSYDALSPGPANFPLPSPRMLAMRARARSLQAMAQDYEYMGW